MPIAGIDASPLQWPAGWKRSTSRKSARYEVSFSAARDDAIRNLKLMGIRAEDIVISSNVPVRRDGLPYADPAAPSDSGVAIYWVERSGKDVVQRVMACDCWKTVRDNLRAIGLSLEAMRSLKRAGATQILDRAFAGFVALPADTKRPWRDVLGLRLHSSPLNRTLIEEAYKRRALECHPDSGGSHEQMVELNAARAHALTEIMQ